MTSTAAVPDVTQAVADMKLDGSTRQGLVQRVPVEWQATVSEPTDAEKEHAQMLSQQAHTQEERNILAEVMIGFAAKSGGAAFGGYVRDRVIRGKPWNDLDLWFKSAQDASAFLRALHEAKYVTRVVHDKKISEGPLSFAPTHAPCGDPTLYSFQRMIVLLWDRPKTHRAFLLDVIVAKELPVSDFDCNQVSYDGKDITTHGPTPDLLNKIKAGRATMLPGYMEHVYKLAADKNLAGAIVVLLDTRVQKMARYGFLLSTYDETAVDRERFRKHVKECMRDPVSSFRSLVTASEAARAAGAGQQVAGLAGAGAESKGAADLDNPAASASASDAASGSHAAAATAVAGAGADAGAGTTEPAVISPAAAESAGGFCIVT